MVYKKITRSPAVARIADRTGCEWPSRSSEVIDLYVIWKPVCDFLLVINSNLGSIFHRIATVHSLQADGRRTHDNHDNSSIVICVRSAKNDTETESIAPAEHDYFLDGKQNCLAPSATKWNHQKKSKKTQ